MWTAYMRKCLFGCMQGKRPTLFGYREDTIVRTCLRDYAMHSQEGATKNLAAPTWKCMKGTIWFPLGGGFFCARLSCHFFSFFSIFFFFFFLIGKLATINLWERVVSNHWKSCEKLSRVQSPYYVNLRIRWLFGGTITWFFKRCAREGARLGTAADFFLFFSCMWRSLRVGSEM